MPKGDLNNLPMCQCTDLLICCYVQFTNVWGIERSGFFNGREKWAKGFENQRV